MLDKKCVTYEHLIFSKEKAQVETKEQKPLTWYYLCVLLKYESYFWGFFSIFLSPQALGLGFLTRWLQLLVKIPEGDFPRI